MTLLLSYSCPLADSLPIKSVIVHEAIDEECLGDSFNYTPKIFYFCGHFPNQLLAN